MAKGKPESSKPPTLQIVTDADLLRAFRVACLSRGTNMTAVVNEYMRAYVEQPPPDAKPRKQR